MGFLAWAKRLDDAAEARATGRSAIFAATRDWSPAKTAAGAFATSASIMLVLYGVMRAATDLPVTPFAFLPGLVGVTVGAAVGATMRRDRRP